MHSSQLNQYGQLRHFLSIDYLKMQHIQDILDTADLLLHSDTPKESFKNLLYGKTVVQLFFEPSTRTSTTFELAAKKLDASVLIINTATSSTNKGESLLDTLNTIEAMHCNICIIRHRQSGAAEFIARNIKSNTAIINAGDGCHDHPTQAMLDAFTIGKHKPMFPALQVAFIGDVLHSRVARSLIKTLIILGVKDIRIIAPRTLIPVVIEQLGVSIFNDPSIGLRDVDVIIVLRLQKERMEGAFIPNESEFFRYYGLNEAKLALAKPDAIVLHPGPVNRGIEIESKVANGPQSVILEQVTNGIAVRMAILSILAKNNDNKK